MRMLAKSESARPQTMEQVMDELERVAARLGHPSLPPGPVTGSHPRLARRSSQVDVPVSGFEPTRMGVGTGSGSEPSPGMGNQTTLSASASARSHDIGQDSGQKAVPIESALRGGRRAGRGRGDRRRGLAE